MPEIVVYYLDLSGGDNNILELFRKRTQKIGPIDNPHHNFRY